MKSACALILALMAVLTASIRAGASDPHSGFLPVTGPCKLEFPRDHYEQITAIDAGDLRKELASHAELFGRLHPHLPAELEQTRASFEQRLAA